MLVCQDLLGWMKNERALRMDAAKCMYVELLTATDVPPLSGLN